MIEYTLRPFSFFFLPLLIDQGFGLFQLRRFDLMRTDGSSPSTLFRAIQHLPPRLREVCASSPPALCGYGATLPTISPMTPRWSRASAESSLHFTAHQSGHANPIPRRDA